MNTLIQMAPDAQRQLYEKAGEKTGLPSASIEKDLWVCWTLRELFALPVWGARLTFKGGTALSKCWRLIDRFSEDLDIVVDREFLGFGSERSPERAPSKAQRRNRLTELKWECQRRMRLELKPALEARFAQLLPTFAERQLVVASDEEDPDRQTLLFEYPSAMADKSLYIRPVVKMEMGARSDTEPAGMPTIRPYLAEAFPRVTESSEFSVRALAPERTFWEKVMLLHEETYRPSDKPRKARMARHYYDLWCLITRGVAARAVADAGLFARTVAHRKIFFNWSWMDYDTIKRGTLRLIPSIEQQTEWRQDYRAMQSEMFFGKVPAFDEIMTVVGDFQTTFNKGTTNGTADGN